MSYYMYGGRDDAFTPSASLPVYRRLTPGERKEVHKHQKRARAVTSLSPSSMNRNILKFMDDYERWDKKKPEDYDDALLELESAITRLLELRHQAGKKESERRQIQERLRQKASLAVKAKQLRMKDNAHKYLEEVKRTVPIIPRSLQFDQLLSDANEARKEYEPFGKAEQKFYDDWAPKKK